MRRIRTVIFGLALAVGASCMSSPYAQATSLSIAPLSYEAELKPPEKKKGFVDIANQSKESQTIHLEVQVFRQVDDLGTLKFYPDTQTSAGVQLDHDKIELAPKEGMRVYFLLDSDKLPKGDVFAAIMASTVPKTTNGSAQSARVGTLLIMTNEGHGPREAMITWLTAPWLQIGDGLEANIAVKNTTTKKDTGFFPEVTFTAQPYASKTVQGPLLFAGRTRSITYTQPGNYFGPIYLKAKVLSSEQGKWIFAVTGYWRWVVPLIIALIVLGLWLKKRITIAPRQSKGIKRSYRVRR